METNNNNKNNLNKQTKTCLPLLRFKNKKFEKFNAISIRRQWFNDIHVSGCSDGCVVGIGAMVYASLAYKRDKCRT
jgi:hypothetical protein